MPVPYKPDGYNTVTPYLVVDGAEAVIEFAKRALGAQEVLRLPGADGRIGHAELVIGDSRVMVADAPSPDKLQTAMLHLYVEDADATYRHALDAGATSVREPTTEFYGDRLGGVRDAAGNTWYFATHVEDVSGEELARRAAELAAAPNA
jgi:uncharacterized glyoxalase superfamily protein PhnB